MDPYDAFMRFAVQKHFDDMGLLQGLVLSAIHNHMGFTGHVTDSDRRIAAERDLKPLSEFELWILRPEMEYQREVRLNAFRESIMEVLGEDPDDWG